MTDTHLPEWVQPELQRMPEASARGLASAEPQAFAVAARYDACEQWVVVELANGTFFAFDPLLAQGLSDASAADLAVIELSPLGTGLHWPKLNADLTLAGLLAGVFGGPAWMASVAGENTKICMFKP